MKCEECESENTEIRKKSDKGCLNYVVHCLDCGKDRLPTQEERANFNK
jgi:RNase P subunit RPR2